MVRAPSLTGDRAAPHRISLIRTGDGSGASWVAEVEDLQGCSGRGATPEEAVQRAWAAAQSSLGDEAVTDATPAASPRHSGKLLVRMPATLHDELARAAEAEGVSLNQLITGVLASAVEWRSNDGRPGSRASGEPGEVRRPTRLLLAANLAIVGLAAILAIVLIVLAWRAGIG